MRSRFGHVVAVSAVAAAGFVGSKSQNWKALNLMKKKNDIQVDPESNLKSPGFFDLCIPTLYAQDEDEEDPFKEDFTKTKMMVWAEDSILFKKDFAVAYNRHTRQPNWVFEHYSNDYRIRRKYGPIRFANDPKLDELWLADTKDYSGGLYTRGCLAPHADHKSSKKIFKETFLYSNVSPMIKSFNAEDWTAVESFARSLEKPCCYGPEYKHVYVITGPLFLPHYQETDGTRFVTHEMIGKRQVSVPTHFFKLIVTHSNETEKYHAWAFIIPHEAKPFELRLANYIVDLEQLEQLSGIQFFQQNVVFETFNDLKPVDESRNMYQLNLINGKYVRFQKCKHELYEKY